MNAPDLEVERDWWGGFTAGDELVDVFAGLEEALRARDGHTESGKVEA